MAKINPDEDITKWPLCQFVGKKKWYPSNMNLFNSPTDPPNPKPYIPSRTVLAGQDLDMDNRENLSPSLINAVLDAMSIKYQRIEDGVYELFLPNDTVKILLSLPLASEMCITCAYATLIPGKNFLKALMACNEFHYVSKYGHAYFVPENERDAILIYELYQSFEGGMVSSEYLTRTIIQAIEHAGELFTKVAIDHEVV